MDIIARSSNILCWQNEPYRCALGCSGIVSDKKEGDHGTPIGSFPLRRVFFRPDRLLPPKTSLPMRALHNGDGWCDDVNSIQYNSLIKKPFFGRHEDLWRDDSIYDLIVVLGYNDNPIIKGRGSAIFLHVARSDFSPTEGCLALSIKNLLHILTTVTSETRLVVSTD